jgi:hypothetical protein
MKPNFQVHLDGLSRQQVVEILSALRHAGHTDLSVRVWEQLKEQEKPCPEPPSK